MVLVPSGFSKEEYHRGDWLTSMNLSTAIVVVSIYKIDLYYEEFNYFIHIMCLFTPIYLIDPPRAFRGGVLAAGRH
jgi:uncharacterized membrane protein